MFPRAQASRLFGLAVLAVAVAAGGSSLSAVHAATGKAALPAPASPAGARAAATSALRHAFRARGPLPFQRMPGGHESRVRNVTIEQSGNWSGYVDDNSTGGTYSAVSATWVVPRVTCIATEDRLGGFWVGLDGFTSNTVEQDGTFAWCYQGVAYYYSWYEMFPNAAIVVGTTVAPGDHIIASVTSTSAGYRLVVTDSTHPANSLATTQPCPFGSTCSNASAEWIAETPGGARGTWPWPAFGIWRLANARVTSGKTVGSIKS